MTDEEIIAKGFKPFHGNEQPADFDDSRSVLFGNGAEYGGDREWCWSPERHPSDTIIGYHPKEPTKPTRIVIPDGPAPEWAEERADQLWEANGRGGVLGLVAKLVMLLEQPPVDPVEEAFMDIYNKSFDTQEELIRAALAKGIEMGKGEV